MKPDLNTKWTRIYIERDCTLFPFFTFVYGLGNEIKKLIGKNLSPLVIYFSDKGVEYFTPLDLTKEIGKEAYEKSVNTDFYEQLMRSMDKKIISITDQCKKIRRNINTLNEKEVIATIKNLSKELIELNSLGQLLAIGEYGPNDYISGDLTELVSKKSQAKNLNLSAAKTSALLTTPIKPTLFRRSTLKLMKIAILARKNNYTLQSQPLLDELKKFWYNYLWIDYGYIGPAHSLDYFKKKLEELIKKDNLIVEYVDKLIELYVMGKKQHEYEILLEFNDKDKRRLFLARDMGFYKVFRKEITFFAMYVLDQLVKNLATIRNVDKDIFKNLLPQEYNHEDLQKIADERNKEFIYLVGEDYEEVITGEEVKEIMNLVRKKKDGKEILNIKQLQGTTAQPGKVKGRAKIVMGVNHIHKIEKGDILVSFSTNPQMVLAMEKAGAFITEQGGIACHAAIIAREMKKPCVVGIDNITQILNDGDLIEVDAHEGIVRKLD